MVLLFEAELPPQPDTIFYYVLSILMGMALIWIFQRYIARLDENITKLTESDIKQNFHIEDHGKRIDDLEEKDKVVKYRKA